LTPNKKPEGGRLGAADHRLLYECEAKWDENRLTVTNRQRHRQKHYRRPLYWLHKVAWACANSAAEVRLAKPAIICCATGSR